MKNTKRLQPCEPIKAGSSILGSTVPLVCIPLVGRDEDSIMTEAGNILVIAPDIIELRIDAWNFVEDVPKSVGMIEKVRSILGETPIILTCRGDWEGGFKKVDDSAKFTIYAEAVKRGLVDFIDMELKYGQEKISEILGLLENSNTHLIVSFHDFQMTPSEDELVSIMEREIRVGAHIAKLAAMPRCEEDVLSVMKATLAVRRKYPDIPIITMSMGPMGAVTRLIGGFFGSDLTFAVGSSASAPGQIPVAELRQCFGVVYPK